MARQCLPWGRGPRRHVVVPDANVDNRGGTICSRCGLVLSGPLAALANHRATHREGQ